MNTREYYAQTFKAERPKFVRVLRAVPAGQACNASRTCRVTSGLAVGSGAKGGGLVDCRWTSFRVASVTPTTVPAAAAAASATMIQTLARALIPGDAS